MERRMYWPQSMLSMRIFCRSSRAMHQPVGVLLVQLPAKNNPIPFQVTRLGKTSRMILIGSFNALEGGRFGLAR